MTDAAVPQWLSKAQVLYIHEAAIKRHGGSFGLRDEGLLESALARAENYYAYGEVDLFLLAAIRKNGKSASGKQKYHCKACNAYGTLNPSPGYSPERKAEILRAYQERSSLRGLERMGWHGRRSPLGSGGTAEALPTLPPLAPTTPEDVLELDEM